eukprot:gene8758-biopygen116
MRASPLPGDWQVTEATDRRLAGESPQSPATAWQVAGRWLAGDGQVTGRRRAGDWQATGRRLAGDWQVTGR